MTNNPKKISDKQRYEQLQEIKAAEWEATCINCGACCGALDGDPCNHLKKTGKDKYFCDIYESRFGLHKTRDGRVFRCVPLRQILYHSWPGDVNCACKRKYKA